MKPVPNAFQELTGTQRQLLKDLIELNVSFFVVGGYAVRAHGDLGRKAHDLDIVVAANPDNADSVIAVLEGSPFKASERTREDLCKPHHWFDFGDVDIFTGFNGKTYEDLQNRSIKVDWNAKKVPIVSHTDLLNAKRSRLPERLKTKHGAVDLDDIAFLESLDETDNKQ